MSPPISQQPSDRSPAARSAIGYRPEIDGLRCIAVCAVILYHAHIAPFTGGYIGVDVFFVISGYLIAGIIHSEIQRGHFTFAGFYERRARRIFPALFLVISSCIPLAFLLLTPKEFKDFSQSIVAVTGFVSNYFFLLKTGYFGNNADQIPLLHAWSLSVEEQFYVVFPIVLLLVARFVPRRLNLILVTGWLLSFALCLYREYEPQQSLNFFSAGTRAWELLSGALLAVAYDFSAAQVRGRLRRWANPLSLLGLGLILVPMVLMTRNTPFPGDFALLPICGTMLLIAFGHGQTWAGRLLGSAVPVFIGQISYSLYLWHQPVFAFARIASTTPLHDWQMGLLIASAIGLAFLSWRFVEQPFRKRSGFSRRTIFTFSVIASVLLIGFGAAGHVFQGYPGRFSRDQLAIAATARPSPFRDTCHTEGTDYRRPADACRYFGKSVTWAVMGDSHAIELAYDLAQRLKRRDTGILHLTSSGCAPALTFESLIPGCSAWTRESVDYLISHPEIRNVVLIYFYGGQLSDVITSSYPDLPADHPNFLLAERADAAREDYWRSFSTMITRLRAAGKRVFVLEPTPELPRSVEWNIFHRLAPGESRSDNLGPNVDFYQRRNHFILSRFDTLPWGANLIRIRTRDAFCNARDCYAIRKGQALFFDDHHPSLAGAQGLADMILAKAP